MYHIKLNGELISRSKCKHQAATLQKQLCNLNGNLTVPTDTSEQARNQLNLLKDIGIQSRERKLTQQTGQTELLENKTIIYQTLVFLPGPDLTESSRTSSELTKSIQNEPVITDTGQFWQVENLDDSITFLCEELLTPIALPAQSAHQGEELNTPTIDNHQKGFENYEYQSQKDDNAITLNKFIDNQDQVQEKLEIENTITKSINLNKEETTKENILNLDNIGELLSDGQMFQLDCDPTFFDSMNIEENLNNNIGLEQIKDLNIISDEFWTRAPVDIEIFSELPDSLFESSIMMEKKEEPLVITAPPSPVVEEAVEIKSENLDFDLIKYIIFGDNDELLTPVDEKGCPNFQPLIDEKKIVYKTDPEPSTSTKKIDIKQEESTPKSSEFEKNGKSLRRRAPKRRYSSDSDYSIKTSASSFNSNTQRLSKKKRGRPAKELITDLPTIDDFSHMPIEHASHLVLRIKNNEASRKSRMKSKSKQTAMEDECDRLESRQSRLKIKRNKLEGQIETLRRWLLGLN
ncbi:CLUMA_CG006530, isoform A [Clunio marinus]|uniref:CLUMA_CG006530, isoform A n=1 Tax=Clunio marinus TaxID=568069 RepID=A0A1J1I0H7_9DIPT|nr:CLUMA_CG006530, isoform A [Clunio marinus]